MKLSFHVPLRSPLPFYPNPSMRERRIRIGGVIHGSGLLREQQLAGAQQGLQEMPNTDKG